MSANMSVMLAELLEANAALSESTPDLPTSCLQNRFRLHKPCATERLQRINVFLTYTPWHLFFCLTAIFDAEGRRERAVFQTESFAMHLSCGVDSPSCGAMRGH